MSESKVLIIVGDASETLDTMYPFYRLQEDNFVPVVAGPEKKLYQMVMHVYISSHQVTLLLQEQKPVISMRKSQS